MGAAGDMLASALFELFDNRAELLDELNALALPDTKIEYEAAEGEISGAHLHIIIGGHEETPDHHHDGHSHHHGRSLDEVYKIIDLLNTNSEVKENAKAVYLIVAEAEAMAHGAPVGEVHFHELGMLDAIADVTISAYLINKLSPQRILASPINVGNGTVKCAHGVLPVPAPATANILLGVPYYKSDIQTELCTPTGAAIIKYYADEFVEAPLLSSVKSIGIGVGTKKLERPNIVRAFLFDDGCITELSCNVDDMTGEETAFACEIMMKEGALDCFVTPILMKKGRPAYMLTVLCSNTDCERFSELIFKHTTTLGIRKYTPSRYTLDREINESAGVQIKRSHGFGTTKEKIEFEDLKALALEKNISIFEARQELEKKD